MWLPHLFGGEIYGTKKIYPCSLNVRRCHQSEQTKKKYGSLCYKKSQAKVKQLSDVSEELVCCVFTDDFLFLK